MVNVGIAGIGFMGMIHYLAYQKVRGAKVHAISTRNEKRLKGDWRGIQGNFGPEGTMMDLSGVEGYVSFDEMLADPKIDVVDLCLPPALHKTATLAALKAGKHVLCEKPISLTTRDAVQMVDAAKRAKRQLMIAHVLPFFPEFNFVYKNVTSGRYGRLLGGHFKRIISDPLWLEGFYDPRVVGGPVIDLHIHDAHFIRLLCGMPESVFSTGRVRGDVVEFINTQFLFGQDGPQVTAVSGVIQQQGRPFTHGFEIYLERATLMFEFAAVGSEAITTMPLTVLNEKGSVLQPKLGSNDPIDVFAAELSEMARAVRTGEASPLLGGDLARDALLMCQKETQSVMRGSRVKV